MHNYSDEPVLIKAPRRLAAKHWIAIVLTLGIAGGAIYIPIDKSRMEERSHHAARGPHSGALHSINADGKPLTLELAWRQNKFAPVLQPAPAPGTTLVLSSRAGTETLPWNEKIGAFGPGSQVIDPYSHYKLDLTLRLEGRKLWHGSLWAYGYHDPSAHSH
jgi:hypothetical protein